MRINEIIASGLTFQTHNRGYHHGQSDRTLAAYRDGQYVGHIDYSDYEGEPHVQMIDVPTARRQGIGSALVQQLQREYPGIEINMGGTTEMGSQMLASLPSTVLNNPEYQKLKARLDQLYAQEHEWEKYADDFYANPTDQGRAYLQAIGPSWNEVSDEIREIEERLRDMRPATRLYTDNGAVAQR